jgi:predicted nucleic acid-binding protein
MRRGRIDAEFRRPALADLELLDVTTDEHTDLHAWSAILRLADRFRLTVDDAAYLELAYRHKLPLASLDGVLCSAGSHLGLRLLGRD